MKSLVLYSLCLIILAITPILPELKAQDVSSGNFGVDQEVLKRELAELKKVGLEQFQNMYLDIKAKVDVFIDQKRLECTGEFTRFVKNDLGELETVKRKLTREEIKDCLIELKAFHVYYLEQTIDARKSYLEKTHLKHMKEFEEQKSIILSELEKTYKDIEKKATKLK